MLEDSCTSAVGGQTPCVEKVRTTLQAFVVQQGENNVRLHDAVVRVQNVLNRMDGAPQGESGNNPKSESCGIIAGMEEGLAGTI